jgi:hypothetical protein
LDNNHPAQVLRTRLEDQRLSAVQTLASTDAAVNPDALNELACLQLALTAVREEIAEHSVKFGWGSPEALE